MRCRYPVLRTVGPVERLALFALLRLTGATRGQVLQMMSMEGVLIAAIGIVLGTAVSTTALVPFSVAASDSLMPSGPRWIYPAVIGAAAVLTLSATLLPTWQALRSPPGRRRRTGLTGH
jgi:putative ABC transport system permease protein